VLVAYDHNKYVSSKGSTFGEEHDSAGSSKQFVSWGLGKHNFHFVTDSKNQ
jgi:hypothetical protein